MVTGPRALGAAHRVVEWSLLATVSLGALLLGSGSVVHARPTRSETRFLREPEPTGDREGSLPPAPSNLTPDPKTSRMAGWSEQAFLARMRAGPTVVTTHMPWGAFRRTIDADLPAIYVSLQSVDPVERDTGPNLQDAP